MAQKTFDQTPTKSANLFPVVGIGASAGGLDAFKKLLKAIPEDSGMAYVLVQHLDPKHESLLPELLQKVTKIPVLEITDDINVHPDHIYVIPANKMMVATDGVLLLAPRPEKSKTGRNLPIDLFFTSLAEVHQAHAIGVVLSGTASDGTMGLKAIKEQGGITFAQDEASAEYESMPHSAAEAGVVDFILPPGDIPKKLLEIANKIKLTDEELQNIPKQDEDVFKQILSLLRIRKGVDFTYYKQTTIRRRILRRMLVNKNEEPGEYLTFLRGHIQEQDLLYQDMLIPVTSFFRDKKVFESLCNEVFPTILKNKVPGEITRIWVAGCSTGQEVYSFAICFKEFLGDNHERIQIFGTDLSEPAILKARIGMYEKSEVDGVSAQSLAEYFTKHNGGYQVNKSIRDMCVFAHHNFLKDPPFGKMDCISCRNVLIYMEPYLQKKALTTFHYALNPKGFLLLGKSETTGGVPDLFALSHPKDGGKNDKLYTRKDVPSRFMQVASQRSEQVLNRATDHSKSDSDSYRNRTDFQKTADDILLTKYTPAGVVVNEAMDIVHFRGNTANYLEQAPGKPSHNLMMMAKNGLGFELRNILHKAKTENAPVLKENIPLHVNGSLRNISIEAVPLPNTLEPYYLLLFHDNNLTNADGSVTGSKRKVSAKAKKDEKDIRIQLLEQELAQAREDMRSITEDQEASNEELQSANEELLSGSEELQSLNEELETSKEELQSTNEELTVLNHELLGLNEQVTDARNYSESIVATLYQPLLVLDKHLRVKTANKAFYKTFNVNEQETEGVLIYDLGNRQWNIPELRTLLEEVLPQKKQIADFEVTHNFTSIGERIIVLNALELTREKKEEKLILLSIEDITEQRHSQVKEKKFLSRFHNLLLQTSVPIAIFRGSNYIVELVNDSGLGLMVKDKGFIGKLLFEASPELEKPFKEILDKVVQSGIPFNANEMEITLFRKGKMETGWFNLHYQPIREDDNTISGILASANEVTEQVLARRNLEDSEKQLQIIFSNAPAAIAVLEGTDFKFVLANADYQKMINRSEAQLLGKTPLEVFPELTGTQAIEIFENALKTGEAFSADEYPVMADFDNNGVMRQAYYKFTAQPIKNADGKFNAIMIIAFDVTEQIKARKKIEDSDKRYNMMVMQSPFAFAVLKGKDMVVTLANDSIKQMWGKGNEIEGKPLIEILPEIEDQIFPELLDKVYTTGIPYTASESLARVKRNGKIEDVYFNFVYQPYQEADETISGVTVIANEVTEQVIAKRKIEESEHRYQQMIYSSPSLIAILKGENNIITIANDAIIEIWGKGKDVIGKPFLEVLPELIEQGVEQELRNVYTTGIPSRADERPVNILRNGKMELLYYSYVFQAQHNATGAIEGIAIIGSEVTFQALANKKIKASEEKFRLLVMQAPVAICVLRGKDYVIETMNEGMSEFWGRSIEQALNKPVFDVIPEVRDQEIKELLDNVYNTGERFVADELQINLNRNGKLEAAFVKFVYEPLREADGSISGVMALAHEITEQVLSRKKIEESEAFNSSILENSPDCVKLIDIDGRIQYMNVNGLCIMEIDDFSTLKNTPWTDTWGIENRPLVLEAFDKALQGTTAQFQAFCPTAKGTEKWWDVLVSPVMQPGSNTVTNIISVSRDITAQKEIQSQLEYRKALLEAHNEASTEGILLVDTKGKIISYNKKFIEIWNMPTHIVEAQDDVAALDFARNQLLNPDLFTEKVNYLYENIDETSHDLLEVTNGKIVERHGYPVKAPDGSYYAWSWTFRDITSQKLYEKYIKQSEEHFRLMADNMPQKVWTADAAGNYNYFNQCWLDYTGQTFEDLKNWGWKQSVHPEDWEETKEKWLDAIGTGENFEMEHRLTTSAGVFKWHLSRGILHQAENGTEKIWIGTNTEMQSIKEEEQRKGDFLKMVSHELKTPVTSIKGYVQLLLSMLKDTPETELARLPLLPFLTRVDSQVLRLTRLITEMLDLTRLETGMLELKKESFGLHELVNETVNDITYTNTKHIIHIHNDFTGMVYGDKDRLGQVLINLITNAIKYSTDNNAIDVTIYQPENNQIAVSIKDYGIGINKTDQLKIFERFFRAGGKSEETYPGFGVGLYIANQIVERHHGFITVESEKEKGSTFTFTLPLANP